MHGESMDNIFQTTAYHKSGIDNALKSITWQYYYPDTKKTAWLGKGIYFWERKSDAEWWDGQYTNPVITSALLKCNLAEYLNLDSESGMSQFKDFLDKFQDYFKESGLDVILQSNDDYRLALAFCQLYKEMNNIMLIKYSFPEISRKPQFCATDRSVVSNIKLVSTQIDGNWKWI